jgi:hypothetical protein
MEAFYTGSLAWKDSLCPFLFNEGACEYRRNVDNLEPLRVKSASGVVRSLAQCDISVGWRTQTQIRHPFLCQRRSTSVHAVAGKASPLETSEDDHLHTRVKLLQDGVGPNKTLLDAQARVCTGPTQTRPLDEDQAFKVLTTILQSGTPHFFL